MANDANDHKWTGSYQLCCSRPVSSASISCCSEYASDHRRRSLAIIPSTTRPIRAETTMLRPERMLELGLQLADCSAVAQGTGVDVGNAQEGEEVEVKAEEDSDAD